MRSSTRVDGVLIPGSRSNVHPSRYGEPATPKSEPYDAPPRRHHAAAHPGRDPARRAALRHLPRHAGTERRPRRHAHLRDPGIGRPATTIARRSPTVQDERFAIRQDVHVDRGQRRSRGIIGAGAVRVNSLHRQGIGRLGRPARRRGDRARRHDRGGPRRRRARLRHRRPVAPGILGGERRAVGQALRRLRQGDPRPHGGARRHRAGDRRGMTRPPIARTAPQLGSPVAARRRGGRGRRAGPPRHRRSRRPSSASAPSPSRRRRPASPAPWPRPRAWRGPRR